MAHEYVYKISSRYLQKWLRYDIKHVKNRHFSRHFGTFPWFSEFYFLTNFDASKSVLGSFFAFFAKIWPKNMYRSSKSRNFFAWPFLPGDLTWPWPLLWSWSTVNDTYKCQRPLSMPISWLCLCLTSQFCSPMSPKCRIARNVEHFDFDLTCDVTRDPEVNKICFLSTVFPGLSNAAWIFRIGPVVSEIRGGLEIAPPPSGARYKNTPVGRGLMEIWE